MKEVDNGKAFDVSSGSMMSSGQRVVRRSWLLLFLFVSCFLLSRIINQRFSTTKNTAFTDSTKPTIVAHPLSQRLFHKCNDEKLPFISGLLETAEYLLFHPQTSFIRFGDFDLKLVMGQSTANQNVSLELQQALLNILKDNDPNIAIGLPDIFGGYPAVRSSVTKIWDTWPHFRQWLLSNIDLNRRYFQTWISQLYIVRQDDNCFNTTLIYETLRDIWKGKSIMIVRGDNKQKYKRDIFDTALSRTILYAPRYQAWTSYRALKEKIFQEHEVDIYIFTCGVVGKILTYDLSKSGRRALDLGHLPKDYDYYYGNGLRKDYYID